MVETESLAALARQLVFVEHRPPAGWKMLVGQSEARKAQGPEGVARLARQHLEA